MDKWNWDEEEDDLDFDSDDFEVPEALLSKAEEAEKSEDDEEKLNAILPVGFGSSLWKHFGFPVNWCDLIWSRARVICRTCKMALVVDGDVVGKMRLHLQQCHPEVVEPEHMCAINHIPSYRFPTKEEAAQFERTIDDEEDELSEEKDDDDESMEAEEEEENGVYDEEEPSEEKDEGMDDKEEEEPLQENENSGDFVEEESKKKEVSLPDQIDNIVNYCIKIMRPVAFEDTCALCRVPFEGLSKDEVYSRLPSKYKELKAKFSLEELIGPSGLCSLSFEVWDGGIEMDEYLTVSINYLDLKDVSQLKNKILFTRKLGQLEDEVSGRRQTPKKDFFETLRSEWGLKKEQIVAAVCSIEMMRSCLLGMEQTEVPVVFCFLGFLDKLVQEQLFSLPRVRSVIHQSHLGGCLFAPNNVHTYWDEYLPKLRGRLTCPEDCELDEEQVFLLRQLLVVLEYLNLALVTYREERPYGQVSILAPILNKMLSHFEPCDQDNLVLSKMKQVVVASTRRTYSKIMPFLFKATNLEPRFRGELNPNKDQNVKEKEVQEQLDKFGAGAPTDFLVSSVSWWGEKKNQEDFPLLLPLVRKFQCVPGTCIPHSRVLGDSFAYSRQDIKEEFLDPLLFLWSNRQLYD